MPEALADLLASMDTDKVLAFKVSEKAQARLEELLEKNTAEIGIYFRPVP